MTHQELIAHEELLLNIMRFTCCSGVHELALMRIVDLHKPYLVNDVYLCDVEPLAYPCPTIEAIEKELI